MAQSPSQQSSERTFIAVDFRGVQQASRERTSLGVVGAAGIAVLSALSAPLPEAAEREEDAEVRPQRAPATEAVLDLGGEGARAAYAYAALGGLVRLAAPVGADASGDLLLRWLTERGVETEHVSRSGRTETTLHLAAPGVQPFAITSAEAAAGGWPDGSPQNLADVVLGERGSALLLAGYPYVPSLRGPAAVHLLQTARERGVRTVLSLSPVALGGPGQPLSPADLETLLPHVDLLCGGGPELRRATRRSNSQDAARAVIDGGARAVLYKRGTEGAALFRLGPAALEREDTTAPAAAARLAGAAPTPLRLAASFGAVFDAAYLLGGALNDASPVRFAFSAAVRAAISPSGVLGI
jgi:sugar/nucleoside kinase (ribokinase family)